MKKILIYFLLLAAVLPMSSCRRAAEKAREKIRVEAVEKVDRHGLSGVDLTLRVNNGSGYKLSLKEARLELFYAGSEVAAVTLREGVEIPRRTVQSVTLQWRIRISDPLALYVLSQKAGQGDLSQVFVSFSVDGRGGPAKVNISREMMPLPEFLNIFGLSLDDVKKYFAS